MSSPEYFKQYYQDHREEKIKQACEWQQRNKEHRREYMRQYARENKEKFRRTPEQQAEYNKRRREKYAQDKEFRDNAKRKVKEYYQSNPEVRMAQRLKKYGITPDDYRKMLEYQNGGCAICGAKDSGCSKKERLHVDHCHQSGKVRGLLCVNCNQGIGKFKDSTELLSSALSYIDKDDDKMPQIEMTIPEWLQEPPV